VLYPPFELLVIIATGNHFFVDVAADTLVAAVAATGSALITRPAGIARLSALSSAAQAAAPAEELAA